VGDDDQTIYGYQGAKPDWLIRSADIFPGAGDHPLEVNYRCPGPIVDAARNLLKHNTRRIPKNFRSADNSPSVEKVVEIRKTGSNPVSTVAETMKGIQAEISAGTDPSEIAVLARVNTLLVPVQVALQRKDIPVVGVAGEQFLSRTAVRSIFGWFRLARPDVAIERDDLLEALRRPSRTFSPNVQKWITEQSSVSELERLANRIKDDRDKGKLKGFISDIRKVEKAIEMNRSSWDVVDLIMRKVGVSAAIQSFDSHRHGSNKPSQNDDVLVIEQLAKIFPDPRTFVESVSRALRVKDQEGGVTLSTIHKVKGLEWPVVFVHQVDQDQFPHKLAEDEEEERRIFHVAITRASRRVYLVSGEEQSQYLAEIENPKVDEPPKTTVRTRERVQNQVEKRAPRSTPPPERQVSNPSGSLNQASVVFAAIGIELVDAGVWRITKVHDSYVEVQQGQAIREIQFGLRVRTVGNQVGILTLPAKELKPASIRAFDLLRQTREALSGSRPAFIIAHDSTLEQIALALPQSVQELAIIRGIGPTKLEIYGDAFLTCIEQATSPEFPE
jgi:DNA helicase-2/ATP-dependent DNA helicase PcrA